jgi:hypothetical protein
MHPEHRVKVPLITNHENVTASIASIPSRPDSLHDTINSLINQVDQIFVYLNNWDYTPDFLNHPKITYYHSKYAAGDLGDAGKFYGANKIKGYHFTCDDDINYPKDYVKEMVHAIEREQRRCIVTFHGRKFFKKPVTSYYHSAELRISCLKQSVADTIIDIPGTGVMAYHTDTISFSEDDFKISNMADIWVGKKAKELNIDILCLKHSSGWISESKKIRKADTIYYSCNGNDKQQTDIVNSFL